MNQEYFLEGGSQQRDRRSISRVGTLIPIKREFTRGVPTGTKRSKEARSTIWSLKVRRIRKSVPQRMKSKRRMTERDWNKNWSLRKPITSVRYIHRRKGRPPERT